MHNALTTLAGRSESWKLIIEPAWTVVLSRSVDHRWFQFTTVCTENEFLYQLLCVTVLAVKTFFVVSCVGVIWVVCAVVWEFFFLILY